MADTNDLVKTVIQVLHDGERGFVDIGEHLKSPELKTFFLQEATTRGQFARELQASAGVSEDVGGTASGTVHRVWGDLKANLGGGDHTLLETAEQGEDVAKKAYKEALDDAALPSGVRTVLQKQQLHIQASHDKVKGYRDSLAS